MAALPPVMHGQSVKDPEDDALAPASMPREQQGQSQNGNPEDRAGIQGGQLGGGPDVVQHH